MRAFLFWVSVFALLIFWIACSQVTPAVAVAESAGQAVTISYRRVVIDAKTEPTDVVATVSGIDINQDGRLDLVFADEAATERAWYENRADGTWLKHAMPSGVSESGFACSDINLDGKVDCTDGSQWYENVGGGSFVAHAFPQPIGDHNVVIADVDGNGLPDIVGRPDTSDQVGILYQGPIGTWTLQNLNPGICRNGLDVADIDGDGRLDIVLCGVWLQHPCTAGAAWIQHTFGQWNDFATVTAVDVDKDGDLDVFLTVSEDVGPLAWFENPGNARNAGAWVEHVVDPAFPKAHAAVVGDFNRDGLIDFAASSYDGFSGPLNVYTNLGGGLSWSVATLGNDTLHSFIAADLNGDGVVDFAGASFKNNITDGLFSYLSSNALACGSTANGSGGSSSGGSSSGGKTGTSSGGAAKGGASSGGAASGGVTSGGATSGGATSGGMTSAGATSGAGSGMSVRIGETSSTGVSDGNQGLIIAQKVTAPSAGTLVSLSFFVSAPSGKLLLGLYDAAGTGGNPKNRIATVELTTLASGWNTASVTPVALAAGTYWLVHEPSSGSMSYVQVGGGNAIWATSAYPPSPATLPTTFPTSGLSTAAIHWSFYGTESQ